MKRIFSGIQPSGIPHLGNYLGAIRHWKTLQKDYECLYCLVDMHAITVWQDPKILRENTLTQTAILLASGIDPNQHTLFNQSSVSAHARLAWIFNCIARIGWLNRMTQFKDKAGKNKEKFSSGLYVYPNLMAADILAYKATVVPVGEDQKQHIELANAIARKFNHDYQVDFFPEIEPLIFSTAARIMSLKDGSKKMSKSDPSPQSRIELTDDKDEIIRKVKRAKTDPLPLPDKLSDLQARPEAKNLLTIYAALSDKTLPHILERFAGQGFKEFKGALGELLVEKISPITEKTNDLLKNKDHLLEILKNGAQHAACISDPIVKQAEDIVGFLV